VRVFVLTFDIESAGCRQLRCHGSRPQAASLLARGPLEGSACLSAGAGAGAGAGAACPAGRPAGQAEGRAWPECFRMDCITIQNAAASATVSR
jgi:hypothetical protein